MKNLTAWEKYKQSLGETRPWNILNPNTEYAEKEESERRYAICQECPELIQLTKTCKKCGCFMSAKSKILNAACPVGKW